MNHMLAIAPWRAVTDRAALRALCELEMAQPGHARLYGRVTTLKWSAETPPAPCYLKLDFAAGSILRCSWYEE
jgi:hypothetical protein